MNFPKILRLLILPKVLCDFCRKNSYKIMAHWNLFGVLLLLNASVNWKQKIRDWKRCLKECNFPSRFERTLKKVFLSAKSDQHIEPATRGVLWKKVFSEISQNSQKNTCARISFLIKLKASDKKAQWLELCYWKNLIFLWKLHFQLSITSNEQTTSIH